jgi:hypothetical protein
MRAQQTPPTGSGVRRSRKRGIALVILVLALAAFAPAAGAHTTQGYATPGNDGWHPWDTDRCSTPGANINAVPGVFDFGHACVHHDGCYKGFPKSSGGPPTYWVSRSQCDYWFLLDMQASCRWKHGGNPSATWAGRQCLQWASNYHWAVRTYGRNAYKGPNPA